MQGASCEYGVANQQEAATFMFGNERREVVYQVRDGRAIFEGDIILGDVAEIRAAQVAGKFIPQGFARSDARYRWPEARIPYEINFPEPSRILKAMRHWERHTPIRFRLRDGTNSGLYNDYVVFELSQDACQSDIGRQGGVQRVRIGLTCSIGTIIHEIGHTVGLSHEHNRFDRDKYVRVEWDNIVNGQATNFTRPSEPSVMLGKYDYNSIMHYDRFAFSTGV
jgi:hypothetical protein